MSIKQVICLALLVLGVVLLFFAWQSSQAVDDRIMEAVAGRFTEAVTGRFTDSTIWLFIGGVISAALGIGLLVIKRGK